MPNAWSAPHEALASMRYFDRQFKRNAMKILPGEYYTTGDDYVLSTVLGSCVSACLRDPAAGVGGMNHFMLPEAEDSRGNDSARYGSYAMELLVNELLKLGARRDRMEAKVFGGGHVLRSMTANKIGDRNIDFVRGYLRTERIRVVAEDLGDRWARKLMFLTGSGQVFVRRIDCNAVGDELASESAYRNRLKSHPLAGEVELFD